MLICAKKVNAGEVRGRFTKKKKKKEEEKKKGKQPPRMSRKEKLIETLYVYTEE